MFVHCQLTTLLTCEGSRLVPRPVENGNEASRLCINLEFQKLRVYLHLTTLASQDLPVVAP